MNDFDSTNIKDGLAEIDNELDALEDQKPQDSGEPADAEIQEVMQANMALR